VRALSVLPADLPSAIERMQTDAKDLRRQVKDLQGRVAAQEADALAETASAIGSIKLVTAALPGWDAGGLKTIAARIVERPGYVVVLVSEPAPANIVIGRASDLSQDAGALLRALASRHGGKGGGRPEMAQGGGLTSAAADVLASVRELVLQAARQ